MDETTRKKLVTGRAVAKASLTRLAKFVQEFQTDSDNQAILVRLKELPIIRDKFETAQSQLEIFEDFERYAEDRDHFETMYFDTEAKMNSLIAITTEAATSSIARSSDNLSCSSDTKKAIKLPTIKLPTFNGDVTGFRHFYDTFMSLIVNNESLDNIQRFHYLLSSLTGEAHLLIANLPVTSSNFNVAFDTICNRYNNPRLIASAHLRNLLNLPTMNKPSANELRGLLNQALSNMNALKALELNVPLEDLIVSQLILEKTEASIRREYETTLSPKTFPTLRETCDFLETKCKSIEIVSSSLPLKPNLPNNRIQDSSSRKAFQTQKSYVMTTPQCTYCNEAHALNKCRNFSRISVNERRDFVRRNNLCFNCLRGDHKVQACKSGTCRTCGGWHHTLVHADTTSQNFTQQQGQSRNTETARTSSQPESRINSYCSLKVEPSKHILLSTARVRIRDRNGNWQTCRALLDSGSQSCFMSESCAQRLRLRREPNRTPVQGIGDTMSETKYSVSVDLGSCNSDFITSVSCFVLPKVTDDLPCHIIDSATWNIPQHIVLADPEFYKPSKIDILLGAEVCPYIQQQRRLTRDANHPVLQETKLGWVLTGRYTISERPSGVSRRPVVSCFAKTDIEVQQQLRKFWEIEELNQTPRTRDEEQCEAHFVQHTKKDPTGRFVVRLPFKEDPHKLGDSFQMAAKRFYHLERRLRKQPIMKRDYVKFMTEYEELGHMELTLPSANPTYYVPHHAVVKESSSTTKLRVVFDCSASSSSGFSLNDLLYVGPTVQQDLCSIITRFRTHEIAFTADIEKMYRQVQVDERDCTYQRILWRNDESLPLQEYHLKTVTYGMKSAPFLATRCLNQIAMEAAHELPKASDILLNDFYVDDCMSGSQTLKEALLVQQDLIELLRNSGFALRKWCSNHPAILENVPPEYRETRLPLQLDNDENVKTLGLLWHPASDKFQIVNNVQPNLHASSFSKRTVLATVSSIFDPLGLISPVVILGKIFLQQLWQNRTMWDEPLGTEMTHAWETLYYKLPFIEKIQIDRRVLVDGPIRDIQLHGFCDASEKAYGSCIYIRSTSTHGTTSVRLLCSKSRVAPLKRLSLPRLELCGALLLARLVKKVIIALKLSFSKVILWTDSTIVLAWLAAPSTKWKTFVANRVSEIQDSTQNSEWRHVASEDNPADIISRGCCPDELGNNHLWWQGPSWLRQNHDLWPTLASARLPLTLPEERCKVTCNIATIPDDTIIKRFSKLTKLQRVVAYCLRFARNCRTAQEHRSTGALSLLELNSAILYCIRVAQLTSYFKEIHQLQSKKPVQSQSKLKSLNPILDNANILRVGGRLDTCQHTI